MGVFISFQFFKTMAVFACKFNKDFNASPVFALLFATK
jgi:hypothetical protein